METYQIPMDILKNKDDLALHIFNQDFLMNPSLSRYKDKSRYSLYLTISQYLTRSR